MQFYLANTDEFQSSDKKNIVCLSQTAWDDYGYSTTFKLYYFDSESERVNVGTVKIGRAGMGDDDRTTSLPNYFEILSEDFFSIGQDVSYYENLNFIGEEIRADILNSLNDMALKLDVYEKNIDERVVINSLLRFVSTTSVEGQYRRLAKGDATLTDYHFTYHAPYNRQSDGEMNLEFNVIPESNPPTNIHVIIGRNGVGKTHLFNNMIRSIIDRNPIKPKVGYFESPENGKLFANLVSVSFSAFDKTVPMLEEYDSLDNIKYSYIGLKRLHKTNKKIIIQKSPDFLKDEFALSVENCRYGSKNMRWITALKMLETDPIFNEAEISQIAEIEDDENITKIAGNIFDKLSSGHKIVLLTITRLIETIEEKSLVLLDEPEAYLHPPLLSAFIRALSDLLIKRNAVAIIGTHSPVVLQEVPKSCVWKLRRIGHVAKAERLEIESFGENVGILTREIFGLEVTDSGFHNILKSTVAKYDNYDDAINSFDNQIGLEAKGILRNLYLSKN